MMIADSEAGGLQAFQQPTLSVAAVRLQHACTAGCCRLASWSRDPSCSQPARGGGAAGSRDQGGKRSGVAHSQF